MPLIHSASKAALNKNMETLHADIGKSPHVQSPEQAVAIALNTQRQARKKKPGKRARVLHHRGVVSNRAYDRHVAKPASAGDTDDIKSKTSME